jgi:phosphatidylethanolamine/phosphatidyl-N-methylethanolamine N-methyltransferase
MTGKRAFIKQFWKDKSVGAMSPSSKYLGEKMIENIDFNSDKIIVELGPGTGVFTDEIIARMSDNAVLFVFELNEEFYSQLSDRIKDERVKILHDTAENVEKHLKENGYDHADVIISSLPLAMFSKELRNSVLRASVNALKSDGKYIQFQYSLQALGLLKKSFRNVSLRFTALNFPPAFIYTCRK